MPLTQLFSLVSEGKYASELGSIRIEELHRNTDVLRSEPDETAEDAVLRLFRRAEGQWLSSQFFVRYLGLELWTAQNICRDLAARGLVERRGLTSGTRYCFGSPDTTAAAVS